MRRLSMFWIAWSGFAIGIAPARGRLRLVDDRVPRTGLRFGNVARGSQIRHAFPVVNRTDSDIRIADWRTKCGCTDVKVGARVIPPGTQTTVEATINTTNFQGYKPSGLTLILDRPVFVEVNLNLTCFIRGDILMNPGQVDFGTLRRSAKLPSATLELTYAGGRSDWDIVQMKTQTDRIKARPGRSVGPPTARSAGRSPRRSSPAFPTATSRTRSRSSPTIRPPRRSPSPSWPTSRRASPSRRRSSISAGSARRDGHPAPTSCMFARRPPFSLSKVSRHRAGAGGRGAHAGARSDHVLNLKLKAPKAPGPSTRSSRSRPTSRRNPPPAQGLCDRGAPVSRRRTVRTASVRLRSPAPDRKVDAPAKRIAGDHRGPVGPV